MTQMSFVIAAYVITLGGTAIVTVWAWTSMRKAERAAER
jgi:hypothetical protein